MGIWKFWILFENFDLEVCELDIYVGLGGEKIVGFYRKIESCVYWGILVKWDLEKVRWEGLEIIVRDK